MATEAKVESALDVLRHDYFESVRASAQEYVKRVKNREFGSQEELDDAIRSELDQTYWSIYPHAAYQCLLASGKDLDAWEELEEYGTSLDGRNTICAAASIAHRLDVVEHMGDLDELFETTESDAAEA